MTTALLVNPWIHDYAAYDYWSQPLGLLYLASLLRKNGMEINFVNCLDPNSPALPKPPRRFAAGHGKFFQEEIERPECLRSLPGKFKRYGIIPHIFKNELARCPAPDFVLVTSLMTYWYTGVFESIRAIREVFPSSPIVLGGIYATLCPEHAMRHSGADLVLTGEAEALIGEIFGFLAGCSPYLFQTFPTLTLTLIPLLTC